MKSRKMQAIASIAGFVDILLRRIQVTVGKGSPLGTQCARKGLGNLFQSGI